jgi:DNA-directed RNA polymerase specialized sigma24 family protein
VELRYFLGCTLPECAALLSISTATAERDLTLARTWLYSKLVVTRESVPRRESP